MEKMRIILSVVFLLLSSCLFGQHENDSLHGSATEYKSLFHKTGNDSFSCYRIPAIVTAPNGALIAAIDERIDSCDDLRSHKNINIVVRRSQDNGKTWSPIERVVDFPSGQSASDPSMIVDRITGKIILFYNYMDLDNENGVYYMHVIKSDDSGKTWSKPENITAQITKPGWHSDFKFITSGRGIQTRTGKLLHCLVNLDKGVFVFGSSDSGETWFLKDTPIFPGDESKIVELSDGTWMINSRVKSKGLRWIHTSKDEGKTWKSWADSSLVDPGCNASIIRYTSIENGFEKNRLIFSNANMISNRENMTVRISYDEGKTWSEGKTIYAGPSAYSSLTILKNGHIGLLFEKDEYTDNVFLSFTLEWLTDGSDRIVNPLIK